MKKTLLFAAVVLIGFSACKRDGNIVAKVGGTKITEAALEEKLAATPPAYQSYVNTPSGRKQFIDSVVREAIVVEAAKQAGVEKRKEYSEALKEFKAEQQRQLEEYKSGLLIETYIKELHSSIMASDADIQKYYDANKEEFEKPVAYTVRHILVSSKEEAESAYARLQKGESFEKVAKEISQDRGSAQNGGLIGPFRKGELVPEFEKVALSLKNNEMSGIVETSYGYHIIFKVSEQILPAVSFESAAPEIRRIIEKERFEKWFEDKRKSLGVQVNYDLAMPSAAAPYEGAGIEIDEAVESSEK
ncbi:MAG: peptidylprolyl isomerase [Endomicrobia bacterium]|nr:peptidylprolyl isomerase [Endomicrobiia bacterium]MCL2799213.1 peptidylprolyl isomerase [Endomicrobiia bacterium]